MTAVSAVPPSSSQVTREIDWDYFKTPDGQLRTAKGVLSLAAIICVSEGHCYNDSGKFGFSLFIVVLSLIEAIFAIVVFLMKLDKKVVAHINIPLSLLMNDGFMLLFCFVISTLSLLSIGMCEYMLAARIFASLFILSLFLVLVGLVYVDYISWQNFIASKEYRKDVNMTITETSPTVLT
ncbi:uncharacterized protein [Parasteatoda tepidariorum]|uniref:uncharacterized protein n=1 Tax=Parasteatoda tepidariorum TaxID=114398 RepID=UPI00077FDF8C|nr:uncharacterized protein LOC107451137 [Parasteatoda tepidariorum]